MTYTDHFTGLWKSALAGYLGIQSRHHLAPGSPPGIIVPIRIYAYDISES
jgi:hypothetical protein